MKLAIIQLSDIHLQGASDVANRYLPDVATVLNAVSFPPVENIIVAVCGDVAYSGKPAEYEAATDALENLTRQIEAITTKKPDVIVLPGNHDCDLSLGDAVRDLLLQSIPEGKTRLSDKSVIEQCTKVQRPFWQFASTVGFTQPTVDRDHIYLEYRFDFVGKSVRFRCYNTAWVSTLPEQPGRMALPRDYFRNHESEPACDLTISVLHHPTNWLTPVRKREFDVVLDHCSDLVLFGHEHLPEEYTKSDFDGNKVGYLYGGVFQRNPTDCPGYFNVIIVDLAAASFQVHKYERQGKSFVATQTGREWIPLGPRSPEIISGFRLKQSTVDYLEDPEIEFAHGSGRRLSLGDVFVNPDFTNVSPEPTETGIEETKLLKADDFDAFLRDKKKLLILGPERSGRTSLAKKIFWSLFREGIIPLLLPGERLKGSGTDAFADVIRRTVEKHYDSPNISLFDRTPSAKRALIIDAFEHARMTARQRAAFITHAETKFDFIIALGTPLMMVEEVTSGLVREETLPNFSRLEIRELGRAGRRRMARRWHSIGATTDYSAIEERVVESERIIDALLGKSFLPAYPVFILSFLQSIESSRPMDNIGSYGYHYEAFITMALSRHASHISLDIKYQFLSEFAYSLFSSGSEAMDQHELVNFHKQYCEKYGIDPDRKDLMEALIHSRLLELFDEAFRFKYSYGYYFFVARYFRDHIDEPGIRDSIVELSKNLHVESNANIWIFLAHLSKNPFLIETIVQQAAAIFSEFVPIRLADDVSFVRSLANFVPKLALPGTTPQQNTERHYDELDALDRKTRGDVNLDNSDDRSIIRQLDAMIRTIQVLGQVLKNFPGSLTAVEKFTIVDEGVSVGLRGLAFFLKLMEDEKEDIFRFFEERVALRFGGSPNDEELKKRVRAGLFWFLRLGIFGMIKLISHALGAKGEEATYAKVVSARNTPALRLIDISIALDTLQIPKHKILKLYDDLRDDVLNRHLVESLVARHLYLFPVPNNVKDELCRKLGIAVEKLDRLEAALGGHTKRIGPGTREKRPRRARRKAS